MTCHVLKKYGGVHCQWCCTHPEWRAAIEMPVECPDGVTADSIPPEPAKGPGSELKAILTTIGIKSSNCGCNSMAGKMDRWGPDGCEERIEEIVASMMKEARRRKWLQMVPLRGLWAEMLVRQAIAQSRKLTH